jgi:hypothetical protein
MAVANKKLTLRHRVNNVLTDATSVKFSDPNGTYGVRRADTLAVVVADGSNMPRIELGLYSFTFTGVAAGIQLLPLVSGVIYDYWLEVEHNGVKKWENNQFAAVTAIVEPTNLYTTWARFVRRWGLKNITVASQKDGKATDPELNVVQDSFDFATGEIHDTLRGGLHAIPLDFSIYDNEIPQCVSEWVHVLAFAKMYDARGWEDTNKRGNKLSKQVMDVYSEMHLVKMGAKQLLAAPATTSDGTVVTVGGSYIDVSGRTWRYIDGQYVIM